MKIPARVLVLIACSTWHSSGIAAEHQGLKAEVTPYAWLMGIDGDIEAAGREAEIDKSFSDLVDEVDAGFMGMAVVSVNRWVAFTQYDYVKLSADGEGPAGGDIDVELDTQIGTIAVGYRFGNRHTYDLLVGYREIDLESELEVGANRRTGEVDAGDTVIMLRPSIQLSEKWRFNPTLAYAIDGDSENHYELHPEFQYQLSGSFAMRFGYRSLAYEVNSGTEGALGYREFDGKLTGLLVGFGWTFPKAR